MGKSAKATRMQGLKPQKAFKKQPAASAVGGKTHARNIATPAGKKQIMSGSVQKKVVKKPVPRKK
jgi:hypothetical protein